MNAGTLTIIFVGLISHVMQGDFVRATLFASDTIPHAAILLVKEHDLKNSPIFVPFCGSRSAPYPDCGQILEAKQNEQRPGLDEPKCLIAGSCSGLIGYKIDSWLKIQGLQPGVTKALNFDDQVPPLQSTSDCHEVVSSVLAARPGAGFAGFIDYSGSLSPGRPFCDKARFVPAYRWPYIHTIAASVIAQATLVAGVDRIVIRDVNNPNRVIELEPNATIGVLNIPAGQHLVPAEHHFPIHYSAFADCSHTIKAIPITTSASAGACRLRPFFGTSVECSNSQLP